MSRLLPSSLRNRVALTGTLVVALLVVALNAFVYTQLRDALLTNLDSVLEARVQLVVGLRDDLDPEALHRHLDDIGLRALVRTPEGQEMRSAGAPAFGALPVGDRQEPMVGRSVGLPGGGVVTVLASRGGIDATLERLLLLTVIGTVAVVALAYALLRSLASRMLRPVGAVSSTARRIADGNHDERLTTRADDRELQDMVVAFNDMVDALESALARSQQAEAISRQFLADAAHQLRTPAAGIRASVGTLVRTDDHDDRERMIDHLARETARMSRLLSSLLRVARLDSMEPTSFAPVEVAEVVRPLVDGQRVRRPGLTFRLDADDDTTARVDADGLAEAVGNLLDNAARHARDRVVAEVAADGPDLVVRVHDDGPGVDPADRDRIFDRFVTLDDRGGSGLGLPIARGIARAHDGDLRIVDGDFELRVPRRLAADDPDASTAPSAGGRTVHAARSGGHLGAPAS